MAPAAGEQAIFDVLLVAAGRAASLVLDSGLVESWVEGAIYPSEMAFFLAACEVAGVRAVVESGRQDGYSTEILGRWAVTRDAEIVSIDLEHDAERAARCRKRLQSLPLTLVKGNAYTEVGRAVRGLQDRRLGIIVDGPKGWPALSMIAAATEANVHVVGLHNLAHWVPERSWFTELGGFFYEDALFDRDPRWKLLRERETIHARKLEAARSLDISSLGVLVLDAASRRSLRSSRDLRFGLHQPEIVRSIWHLGAFGLTPKLYGLSYRMLGR